MEFEKGRVVISKAGRDKGYFLAVVSADGGCVYVCDGKERPLSNPKKKNPVHLSLTKTVLSESEMATDRALKKSLRLLKGEEEQTQRQ